MKSIYQRFPPIDNPPDLECFFSNGHSYEFPGCRIPEKELYHHAIRLEKLLCSEPVYNNATITERLCLSESVLPQLFDYYRALDARS